MLDAMAEISLEHVSGITECFYCEMPLAGEELEDPRRDPGDNVVCDACYSRLFTSICGRCKNCVDARELESQVGELIAVWQAAPAWNTDLKPGYYRVLSRPFYDDFYTAAYFRPDSVQFIADLDDAGVRAAQNLTEYSGPLCEACRTEIEKKEEGDGQAT